MSKFCSAIYTRRHLSLIISKTIQLARVFDHYKNTFHSSMLNVQVVIQMRGSSRTFYVTYLSVLLDIKLKFKKKSHQYFVKFYNINTFGAGIYFKILAHPVFKM